MSTYRMHWLIKRYYDNWINSATLLEHPHDRERFYKFVKACIRYSRHKNAKQHIYEGWLRYFLDRDVRTKYGDDAIHEAVALFQRILDFSGSKFPDHWIEMKNPLAVANSLRASHSPDQIEKILAEKFGASWKEKRHVS